MNNDFIAGAMSRDYQNPVDHMRMFMTLVNLDLIHGYEFDVEMSEAPDYDVEEPDKMCWCDQCTVYPEPVKLWVRVISNSVADEWGTQEFHEYEVDLILTL